MITLDFETFYGKGYSLTGMTTEAYIRAPQFQVIGLGYQEYNDPPQWVSGHDDIPGVLRKLFDGRQRSVIAHNTAFDAAILSWHYGIQPYLLFDTLSMARPFHRLNAGGSLAALSQHYNLGEKGTEVIQAKDKRLEDFSPEELAAYGEYCKQDVLLTRKLFAKLGHRFTTEELQSIDLTLRMYTQPEADLDPERLTKYRDSIVATKKAIVKRVGIPKTILMSNPKFAGWLESRGVVPPKKLSPTTGKETFAFAKTDEGFQDLLKHEQSDVRAAAWARLGVKSTIAETRATALIGVQQRGLLPVMLNYYGAHTGRFSGGDKLNLQNFPKRAGNTQLRASVTARKGHFIVACDLAQIEARIVAWLAGQINLVLGFANKEDVYSAFAAEIFQKNVGDVTKDERFIGKTCILGLGYGMGWRKLMAQLLSMARVVVSEEEAERYVTTYRVMYPEVKGLWAVFKRMLHNFVCMDSGVHVLTDYRPSVTAPDILRADLGAKEIILPNNLPISYHGIRQVGGNFYYPRDRRQAQAEYFPDELVEAKWKKVYGGLTTENAVQALAAIIIRWQMVSVWRKYKLRPIFQVHDELVYSVPRESLVSAVEGIVETLRTVPDWAPGLPIDCEISVGNNYGELKEIKI